MIQIRSCEGYSVKRYRGYTIKHGEFGWYAIPENQDPGKERWGFSPNMDSKEAVEVWIDEQIDEYQESDLDDLLEFERKESRYTVSYIGYLFEGDKLCERNYHDIDSWKEVEELINHYGDMIHVDDNYYGVSWENGKWF